MDAPEVSILSMESFKCLKAFFLLCSSSILLILSICLDDSFNMLLSSGWDDLRGKSVSIDGESVFGFWKTDAAKFEEFCEVLCIILKLLTFS